MVCGLETAFEYEQDAEKVRQTKVGVISKHGFAAIKCHTSLRVWFSWVVPKVWSKLKRFWYNEINEI